MSAGNAPAADAVAELLQRSRQAVALGLAIAAAGAVAVLATPTVLWAGPFPRTSTTLAAILVIEVGAVGLLCYGIALAERGYQPGSVGDRTDGATSTGRRRRDAWVVWFVGLALLVGGEWYGLVSRSTLGPALLRAGLTLFVVACGLYLRSLQLDRRRRLAGVDGPT